MKASFLTAIFFLPLFSTSALAQETYGQLDAPLVADVLGTQIHTSDPEEMQYVIIRDLLDQYAGDHNIQVQPEEIDAYVEKLRRAMDQDRKKREARRAELARMLESTSRSDTERAAAASEIEILNDLLGTPGGYESDGSGQSEEDMAARRQIAAAFIKQWKVNRALYQQYGGRIIFQQGGPEPLDAYRRFLEERQEQGAFEIFDKSFETAFWRYYVTDSIHSFYSAGSKEESQAFAMPWWLMEQPEEVQ